MLSAIQSNATEHWLVLDMYVPTFPSHSRSVSLAQEIECRLLIVLCGTTELCASLLLGTVRNWHHGLFLLLSYDQPTQEERRCVSGMFVTDLLIYVVCKVSVSLPTLSISRSFVISLCGVGFELSSLLWWAQRTPKPDLHPRT